MLSIRRESVMTVERWPSELPLTALVTIAALVMWAVLFVSVIGIVYAVFLGVFFFVAHAIAVAHIRGSAIRLAPDQLPALHARVQELAARFGMEMPQAYLMQAGGALNAFATRFLGADMLVLYADLLDACGDNESARDMIIAHELGHLKLGHVQWWWLRMPGAVIPFLGSALSRAREYTCDRYGKAGAADADGALLGLTILAAGKHHASSVNRQRFVRQQEDLNTGWMRIGEWLGSHPPLARRLAALEPSLAVGLEPPTTGTVRALAIAATALLVITGAGWGVVKFSGFAQEFSRQVNAASAQTQAGQMESDLLGMSRRVEADLATLATFIEEHRRMTGSYPADAPSFWTAWNRARPNEPPMGDPFSENGLYIYQVNDAGWAVRSVGPDGLPGSADDLIRSSDPK